MKYVTICKEGFVRLHAKKPAKSNFADWTGGLDIFAFNSCAPIYSWAALSVQLPKGATKSDAIAAAQKMMREDAAYTPGLVEMIARGMISRTPEQVKECRAIVHDWFGAV